MKILSETLLLKSIRQNIPPPDARVLVGFGDDVIKSLLENSPALPLMHLLRMFIFLYNIFRFPI
ncbi:MAG: hypothetical protein B5M53_08200 [Candidatus Cloacimonas sp. 4484_209]|nr:MAG: hypothetical protein B5M53_08200 [Candidatus Cloacimonas sp. 4484_209]